MGWYRALEPAARQRVRDYCGSAAEDRVHRDLIRLAYTAVADLAVVPVQDVLGLDSSARMNRPARARGNWTWRLGDGEPRGELAEQLRRLSEISGRARSD